MEEHEPDHPEDEHGQSGRDREQREHRRPGLGLSRFRWGFDDPVLLSGCHGALDSLDDARRCSGKVRPAIGTAAPPDLADWLRVCSRHD